MNPLRAAHHPHRRQRDAGGHEREHRRKGFSRRSRSQGPALTLCVVRSLGSSGIISVRCGDFSRPASQPPPRRHAQPRPGRRAADGRNSPSEEDGGRHSRRPLSTCHRRARHLEWKIRTGCERARGYDHRRCDAARKRRARHRSPSAAVRRSRWPGGSSRPRPVQEAVPREAGRFRGDTGPGALRALDEAFLTYFKAPRAPTPGKMSSS